MQQQQQQLQEDTQASRAQRSRQQRHGWRQQRKRCGQHGRNTQPTTACCNAGQGQACCTRTHHIRLQAGSNSLVSSSRRASSCSLLAHSRHINCLAAVAQPLARGCCSAYRTLEQARKLDKMLSARGTGIDAVLDFDVPDDLLVRLSCKQICIWLLIVLLFARSRPASKHTASHDQHDPGSLPCRQPIAARRDCMAHASHLPAVVP